MGEGWGDKVPPTSLGREQASASLATHAFNLIISRLGLYLKEIIRISYMEVLYLCSEFDVSYDSKNLKHLKYPNVKD